jgi:hypothetical protein
MEGFGEIAISIHCLTKGKLEAGPPGFSMDPANYTTKVREEALPGSKVSHGTSLGEPVPHPEVAQQWSAEFVDRKDMPMLVFKFKYRSRGK